MGPLISDFQPLLNQPFKATILDKEYVLELVEVESVGKPFKEGAREPFSLIFSADTSQGMLQQNIYPIESIELEKRDMFLVPIAEQGGKYHYQVIYN